MLRQKYKALAKYFILSFVFLQKELATYKMRAKFYISLGDLFPVVMFYDGTTKKHDQNVFCIIHQQRGFVGTLL